MSKTLAAYGAWGSPLSAAAVAGGGLRLGRVEIFNNLIYWSEGRPAENGRTSILRACRNGAVDDLLPAPYSARSRVHEYGGGEFHVTRVGIFFVNDRDQQVYLLADGHAPKQITATPEFRFADFAYDAARNRLIAVAERHNIADQHVHPENLLVFINLAAAPEEAVVPLVQGADFYASPRVSPDSAHLAWLEWRLPAMPWDAAALKIAALDENGHPQDPRCIAGGDGSAAFQPEWAQDGTLYFVCDAAGYGALHTFSDGATRLVTDKGSDLSRPLWSFNLRSYALLGDGRAALSLLRDGTNTIATVELDSGALADVPTSLVSTEHICGEGEVIAGIGAAHDHAGAVVRQMPTGDYQVLRPGFETTLSPEDVSRGEPLTLGTGTGPAVYGTLYRPKNELYDAPAGTLPPVIITVHGGPTGQAGRGLKLRTQFFTTRGFAVFDLDYRGSTGYGRDYRKSLDGKWGIFDVEDAETAARDLVGMGYAAPGQAFIYGSSAGGYTVLMALARTKAFAGGVSAYGISDLGVLQRTTHKFESGYILGLIGADASNAGDRMRERSPLTYAADITAPVLLLQGADDKVVPPDQARLIAATLRERAIPVTHIEFEGEAHGFRRAATIEHALEAELAFYRSILGL